MSDAHTARRLLPRALVVLLAITGSVAISLYEFMPLEAVAASVSGSQAPSSVNGPEDAQEVEVLFDELIPKQLREEHVAKEGQEGPVLTALHH